LRCLLRHVTHWPVHFPPHDSLAGGLFSGAITSADSAVEKGSRFDPDRVQGSMYRNRYFKDDYFKALKQLKEVRLPPPLPSRFP
jgi:aflatoxin B1 aldehyde reductase